MTRATRRRYALAGVVAGLLVLPGLTAAGSGPTPAQSFDFNGDGLADLAVGVPDEDIGDQIGAGGVNVLYGSVGGLTAVGDQFWSQATPGVLGVAQGSTPRAAAQDRFGTALASADFNADGHADLAVGVPHDRLPGTSKPVGGVNVLYGKAGGLSSEGDQLWSQADLPGRAERDDQFGMAVAAADFDGDGYADLVVGVPGDDVGLDGNEGSIEIVYGGPDGLVPSGAAVLTRAMTDAAETGRNFGDRLAVGDVNGDGFADVAATGLGQWCWTSCAQEEVTVFLGSEAGLTASGSERWSQESPGVAGDTAQGDGFGFALAMADLSGDGTDDLAIGAPGETDDCTGLFCPLAGAVTVLLGSETGLTADGSQRWDLSSEGVPGESSSEQDTSFGAALAAGDFDRDGFFDLAVGVPWLMASEMIAGGVVVLRGDPIGLTATGAQLWTQASPGVPGANESFDIFGGTLVAGDLGRGTGLDLAIGAFGEDVGSIRNAGSVTVLYASGGGLVGDGAQVWTQGSRGVKESPSRNDRFGARLGNTGWY